MKSNKSELTMSTKQAVILRNLVLRSGGRAARTQGPKPRITMARIGLLRFLCLFLGVSFSSTGFALQINRISSTNLFVDLINLAECNYAQYQITNNDAIPYTNLWVTIGGLTGSIVKLAGGDP